MRRVWLILGFVAVVAADFYLFAAWMGADLDENCGNVGAEPCNGLLRHDGLALLALLLVVTFAAAVLTFRYWRRD